MVFFKNEAVIYTRVSGSKQEDNTSLESIPLIGRFIKCAKCEKPLTGYIVKKKKKIHYYKYGTIGCGCNTNTNKMNQLFQVLIKEKTYKTKKTPHKEEFIKG